MIEEHKLQPVNFVFWLQGFAEIAGTRPTEKQWGVIKEHLEMCFDRVYEESEKSPYPTNNVTGIRLQDPFNGNPFALIC